MAEPSELLFILKPSLVEGAGVGCFALNPIEADTRLAQPANAGAPRRLPEAEIPDDLLKYCPQLETDLYLAPANFAAMSVFWYINHAREPIVDTDGWKLYTARDVEPGEELTLYYPDLLTHPKNADWVIPELHVDPNFVAS